MYARIALGKASSIDIIGGETSGMPGQLLAMLPFLFLLQAWQLFMGANMMRHSAPAMLDPEGWLARPPPPPAPHLAPSLHVRPRRRVAQERSWSARSACVAVTDTSRQGRQAARLCSAVPTRVATAAVCWW